MSRSKREAAIAKGYSSEIAVTNAREATQVHGALRLILGYPTLDLRSRELQLKRFSPPFDA